MGIGKRLIVTIVLVIVSKLMLSQWERIPSVLQYIPDSIYSGDGDCIKYFQKNYSGEIFSELGVSTDSTRLFHKILFDSSLVEIHFFHDGRTVNFFQFFDDGKEEWWRCDFDLNADNVPYLKDEYYYKNGTLVTTRYNEQKQLIKECKSLAKWCDGHTRPNENKMFQMKEFNTNNVLIYHLDLDLLGNGFELQFNNEDEVKSIIQWKSFENLGAKYSLVNGIMTNEKEKR